MTTRKPESGDSRRDEVIAGEYVLGVLSAEDRRKVEARMVLDREFAAMVTRWQFNLSSLDEGYEPVMPPPNVLASIERRIFADQPPPAVVGKSGLWNSLALWRVLSLAAVAGFVALGVLNSGLFATRDPDRLLVAELSGENNAISLLAQYDAESGSLKVTPVAARGEEAKSLEVWLIEGDNPAVSLGILPQTGEGELTISRDLRDRFAAGATLAVSVEPFGGSPTGSATGPVIALGKTRLP